ncbi:hypothetical protein EVAR_38248_1 [Eumeta japonica]|uniref:Uncharacterized protein n=1 Tax=Eumeta variegata TaxID=151549 RepID=A0A4C1YC53_EUMVA|nr:hypothetical protein EVAR_38248_1 [Eumeta japonica]
MVTDGRYLKIKQPVTVRRRLHVGWSNSHAGAFGSLTVGCDVCADDGRGRRLNLPTDARSERPDSTQVQNLPCVISPEVRTRHTHFMTRRRTRLTIGPPSLAVELNPLW